MGAVLMGLGFISIFFGYFFATVFFPILFLVVLAGGFLAIAMAPFYLLLRWILDRDLELDDPRVLVMPITDRRSPMVDFLEVFPQLLGPIERRLASGPIFGRSQIGDMLIEAQKLLGGHFQLRVAKCYAVPNSRTTCCLDFAREVAAHATGAAIDVTMVDISGSSVRMGAFSWQSEEPCAEDDRLDTQRVDAEVWRNRHELARVLKSVGFVNNPHQWWHWSYGDQYWAFASGFDQAIYGPIPASG